jgi:hypothetical protein
VAALVGLAVEAAALAAVVLAGSAAAEILAEAARV